MPATTLSNQRNLVFTREDDYFFGVLHSKLHEMWALRMGTALEDRPRYTPTTTFETFPFPWARGTEPHGDPRVEAIAHAARELVRQRDQWLQAKDSPHPGSSRLATPRPSLGEGLGVRARTLTNLYNRRPDWLSEAHAVLDRAVLDAYGWPHSLGDDEILARLLALNGKRQRRAPAPEALGVL